MIDAVSRAKLERLPLLEKIAATIVLHDPENSFRELIEKCKEISSDIRIIYATDNIESEFNGVSLSKIEEACSSLVPFFTGSGLLFYSEKSYYETRATGFSQIKIDYSVGFDTQVAEAFRLYEAGKKISNQEDFLHLIQFISMNQFNFDYLFFIHEDIVNAKDLSNLRTFNTVRALKRFDSIDEAQLKLQPSQPIFKETTEKSGQRAAALIGESLVSREINRALIRRKVIHAVLLKATSLLWKNDGSSDSRLSELINFCLNTIGKFAKTEIYFAWKLLTKTDQLRFFAFLGHRSIASINKLSGMSWDLFSIRHQETLASTSTKGDFFVPFFVTFDKRFRELRDACPIRSLIIDDQSKTLCTIFADDYEFGIALGSAIDDSLRSKISNPIEKVARIRNDLTDEFIDSIIEELRKDLLLLI